MKCSSFFTWCNGTKIRPVRPICIKQLKEINSIFCIIELAHAPIRTQYFSSTSTLTAFATETDQPSFSQPLSLLEDARGLFSNTSLPHSPPPPLLQSKLRPQDLGNSMKRVRRTGLWPRAYNGFLYFRWLLNAKIVIKRQLWVGVVGGIQLTSFIELAPSIHVVAGH